MIKEDREKDDNREVLEEYKREEEYKRVVLVGGGHANIEVIKASATYKNNYSSTKPRNPLLPLAKFFLISELPSSFYSGFTPPSPPLPFPLSFCLFKIIFGVQ